MESNIRQCKVCNGFKTKIKLPKTEKGFTGNVDDKGKFWMGHVCPDCVPSYRRSKWRVPKGKTNYVCVTCGIDFTSPKLNKTSTCSPKCAIKFKRGKIAKNLSKEEHLTFGVTLNDGLLVPKKD